MPVFPRLARFLLVAAPLLVAPAALPAQSIRFESGPRQVTLLELYTSEGCSSCPPAETWLAQLESTALLWHEVVPLAFHVSYWDHLGWKDRFASKRWPQRQRDYAAEWNSRSVYTPGFVLNGEEWRGWFDNRAQLERSTDSPGVLTATSNDSTEWTITFVPAARPAEDLRAHVALLGNGLATAVRAGENRGRNLLHEFVVLELNSTPMRNADGRFHATVHLVAPAANDAQAASAAVWVSAGTSQAPLQATGGWLAKRK